MRIYKNNAITLLESSFYINLILLTAGTLRLQEETFNCTIKQKILLSLSIGIAFITFCVIVMGNLISRKLKKYCNKAERTLRQSVFQMESTDVIEDESDGYDNGYTCYRDSVLN